MRNYLLSLIAMVLALSSTAYAQSSPYPVYSLTRAPSNMPTPQERDRRHIEEAAILREDEWRQFLEELERSEEGGKSGKPKRPHDRNYIVITS